jgi:gliding motility-associated-like protein
MTGQVTARFLFAFCLVLLPVIGLKSQNIAPNPDLEFYTYCPTGYATEGQSPALPCVPWNDATWGSVDYFHPCSNPSDVGVPANDPGWQYAHSGEGYCGFLLKAANPLDYREYLMAPLLQPLIGGKWYYISFYVSLANSRCGIQQIGAYFSVTPPPYEWGVALPLTDLTPQVETNGAFLSDTAEWMLIEGCFRAEGGEAYVTIGNFHTNADTPLDPTCVSLFQGTYYYLDDIYISEVQPGGVNLELGNDLIECYSVDINSNINGVDYYWSTGSTESSITVTSSGTYYLTVYDGCEAGVDSVDVLITNSAPVEISPNALNLCQGGSVSIQLDPNAGNYLWDDGSTASTYTINSTGVFTVTLDDGCDITSDSIAVTIVAPPAPFSIGGDTLLCTGSQLEIFLDPDLGEFTWQNGSNSNFFVITEAGDYAVTITNMCGIATADLAVEEIMPATLDLSVNNYALCNGEFLEISLDTTLGPYVWQDGSIGPEYLIITSGLYSVTMSSYCGPSADSVLVTSLITPVVDIGDTIALCGGDTLYLTANGLIGNFTWQDSSNNDSLQVTTAGTYALLVDNACGVDSDSVVVLYENLLLPANLGPDIHLCPGDAIVLYAANPSASVIWSNGSIADSIVIDTAGTYYIHEFNNCFSYTDTIIVVVENAPPSIILPQQLTLCQGSLDTLNPGVSGVTYLWNDGSQDPTLSITNPGNYSLTVSNSCGSDIDTVQVLDGGPQPLVSLGTDTSLCPGEMMILNPASTAVNTWMWPDGSTSSSFTVIDSGTVILLVSNACGIDYDTIEIGLLEATPFLTLGADTALCPGESITLSITIPDVQIQWSDGSSNNSLVINDPGNYYASITNSCGTNSDTIVVDSLTPIPQLNLGPDLPLCAGEEITFIPGIQNVNYLWGDGSSNPFFLADHDQTVTLTISNACGSASDTSLVYLSTNGPDVDLGPDILACAGDTIQLLSNVANVSYLWQDGSTNSTFTASTSGNYYLQVLNACGLDTDTIQVDIHGTIPLPSLGPDTVLCEGVSMTLLSNADADTTTTWQNGSTAQSFQVNAPGMYILEQTNHCGTNADTILVDYHPLPIDVDLGPDTILCPGETLLLTAPATNDELMWQDGSSSTTFLASQAGNYSLSISNNCGVRTDEIAILYDDQLLQFSPEVHFELCPGDVIELDATQPFAATYTWNTGSTDPFISITTPDLYSVTVMTNCQQASQDFEVIDKMVCEISDGFFIPNVISPNDDHINDVFTIKAGPDVEINSIDGSIFDRWGSLVFSSKENPFTWNGRFGDQNVNPGVYVYAFQVNYFIDGRVISKIFTGDITVIR